MALRNKATRKLQLTMGIGNIQTVRTTIFLHDIIGSQPVVREPQTRQMNPSIRVQ